MSDKSKNKKWVALVDAAQQLFWKYGFKKVTVEEICREAGSSKMTFYKFFGNKQEIAKTVFDRVVERNVAQFKDLVETASDASDLMQQMMQMKKDGIHEISKEFLADFYANPELGLKDYIDQKTAEVWNEMLIDFKLLQQKGLIRKDMKIEFFLYFTRKYTDLITDPYLLQLYDNPEDLVMEITNFSAYGISPRK
ncbi:TetR/AcrR family transcriptional regulator [Roseimarinus sediminis]|jgi:AcrR family transcriptional regulator|uniref:TetR/AcrR family transcriptional regulator n=1 Tax=Roseimarinus sediminis TaxID=1610899 RepID=UPI003D1EC939